ncbi:thiaminase II/PqqC family protein [Actinokineospora iranica]|uniref:TENA/THI-4/PQQC family protein n=1 Tax=Actinokineospora iranica TaxID=1271860 RepID=A0A1G6WKF0_9PSEU|nr:transcriptional regulator [Actinokineospora iranica]SDD66271.1 TENA/THI-4/PQQC family protein [Actinokineospora iranica]
MERSARELLSTVQRELTPGEHDNRLVPLVESGDAPLSVLGALAAEQHRVITSDWRTFLTLAAQAVDPAAREVFTALAQGEGVALAKLGDFAAACGLDHDAVRAHQPRAGCQAYPAYLAWLALNGAPRDALLAILANFAAWGGYCASVAKALRDHYGFDERGTAFFDFFATPVPEAEELHVTALQEALDHGWRPDTAIGYGRLLQGYELMFWNTLADLAV